ncbi:flagellin [Kordiimonas marina]|uniref:flagellin n=1 Tax=Kordiimonas marina TaxID=2872312 RepID=UPI00248AF307|nr:flagellin [Kordiimonas marina]MCJ9429673.1 flagellin [Kordiimonas marina]
MVESVNTNASSLFGVQFLQKSNRLLGTSEKQLSTGLKVSGAQDDAATYAITNILKGNVAGLNSVKNSLDRAISTSDVALAAGGDIASLLVQLKEKAVQAADPGLDQQSRLALNDQFVALRDQISTAVASAEFNGTNALKAGGDNIVAITGASGGGSITIDAQNLSLGGPNVSLGPTQGISTEADAAAAIAAIDQSIQSVSDSLSKIGSGSAQLHKVKDFTETLSGTTQKGIGALSDADLAAASAQFAANQVKQDLGIQSLSIANKQPAALLGLFRS